MRLYFDEPSRALAATWAEHFELVASERVPAENGFYLWCREGRLALHRGDDARGAWVTPADLARRSTPRSELARACNVGPRSRVLDLMAGWGLDGLALAAGGARVTLVERNVTVWALLDDLLRRLRDAGWRGCDRVQLHRADAWACLARGRACAADVIYLDPMFASRKKGALPGKRMQYLAAVTEPDPHPLGSWLELARARAASRVVLKRRLRDPSVGEAAWQIRGHSVRYDVYRATS